MDLNFFLCRVSLQFYSIFQQVIISGGILSSQTVIDVTHYIMQRVFSTNR